MPGLEHDLLGLGKVVSRIPVQGQLSERSEGYNVLRHDLGWVQKIKAKSKLVFFFHNLSLKHPLWKAALLDTVKQVLSVEIGVHARN